MKTQLNEGQRRRKIMLFTLPLVVVGLLTVLNWKLPALLAGKKGGAATVVTQGINQRLPDAVETKKGAPEDKLAYYERAKTDSVRQAERRKADPYSADSLHGVSVAGRADTNVKRSVGIRGLGRTATDEQADRVLQQVAAMQRSLAAARSDSYPQSAGMGGYPGVRPPVVPVAGYRSAVTAERDPQLEQLNGMLDKLIRVQHPDMSVGRDTEATREPALVVKVALDEGEQESGFMEITTGERDSVVDAEAAIPAVVAGDQTLTSGSTVELRLMKGVVIAGHSLLKDQLLYGLASLRGERLEVTVHSLRVGSAILPVNLQVNDLDGLAGIRVPGAITREVAKESAGEAVNGVNLGSVDPSLGAQAASAGLQFARSLASRKVKLVRVEVPAGYQVLLKNVKR